VRHSLVIDRIDPRQRLPKHGDVITTRRCAYRVLGIEQVLGSRDWHDRWRVAVSKLGDLPVQPGWIDTEEHRSCREVTTEGYRPGEGPADVARALSLPLAPVEAGEQLALVEELPDPAPSDRDPERSEIRYLALNPIVASAPSGREAIAAIRARLRGDVPKDGAA
jgi:hypothetical protein